MFGNSGISANGTGFILLSLRGFTKKGVLMNGMMDGVLTDGMMTGIVLDGTKIVNKHMTHLQAHFHLKAQNGQR